jgi:replication factor C subunit 3/5
MINITHKDGKNTKYGNDAIYTHLNNNSKLLPWSEKYRPGTINNIIYHEKITKVIVNYMELKKLPHLLFYGPPGTGKTSSIVAIAKHYYGEDFQNMVLILNASEERGIETVRNRIKQFVTTYGLAENQSTPPFKLIILDEIDAMTDDAQAILRKVVEKYVNNVRFCFICNYLKKINPAIQSRCIIFRFSPIPDIYLEKFISDICNNENIKMNTNAKRLIIKRTNGDMRKLLNILQSINMYVDSVNNTDITNMGNKIIIIDENTVAKILSCPTDNNIITFLKIIQEYSLKYSYSIITNILYENSISLAELINCVYDYFMDKIINNNNDVIKYDLDKSVKILKNLSVICENLSYCNNDNIQFMSFLSVFYL